MRKKNLDRIEAIQKEMTDPVLWKTGVTIETVHYPKAK